MAAISSPPASVKAARVLEDSHLEKPAELRPSAPPAPNADCCGGNTHNVRTHTRVNTAQMVHKAFFPPVRSSADKLLITLLDTLQCLEPFSTEHPKKLLQAL